MIKNTTFHITFLLSYGFERQVVIEDDGLSLKDITETIQSCINADDFYQLYDVVVDEWLIVKGNTIVAFVIKDIGRDGPKYAAEGFIFK